MKNTNHTAQHFSLHVILRAFGNAIKDFFTSGSNRDFERLKNFISS
jgi:hypothetical protein